MKRVTKQLQEFWSAYRWFVLGLGWVGVIALGLMGFAKNAQANSEALTYFDIAYRVLQLIPMNSGAVPGQVSWELNVARFAMPALAAFTAFQAFALFFREQWQLVRLRLWRDHIIIAGLSRKGFLLARSFCEGGKQVVVIEPDENNDFLEPCREYGAIVLIGDARETTVLRKARLFAARYLIAVSDDGVNAEIAVRAEELSRQRQQGALTTIIHIADPKLCELLREREISMTGPRFRLELFNAFDRGARLWLQQFPVKAALPTPGAPHPVVIGLGRMGESLVIQASRIWWDEYQSSKQRLRISVIDREANSKIESLRLRYPQLSQVCDLLPLQMDVQSPEFRRAAFLYDSQQQCRVTAVYICLDDDNLGLHAGLTLLQQTHPSRIPIVIRMGEDLGLATLLRKEPRTGNPYDDLYTFGLLDRTCTPDLLLGGTHETLALALHDDYVRQQTQQGASPQTNPAMVPWNDLAEEWKESNRRQADHIGTKLKSLGYGITPLTDWSAKSFTFSLDEVETLARMEHERWYADLMSNGWKHSSEFKDVKRKIHPDLVSWQDLPEPERDKNRATVRELPRFLARAGFQLYRLK